MPATGYQLSHDSILTPITLLGGGAGEYGLADIGGTNASTAWVSMQDFERVIAWVFIGTTFNAADDLDECRLEQAQDASGTNAKDLTADGAGLTVRQYDTGNPIDATGNFVVLEAKAEDLDVDGGFTHVRLYIAEGGNTGTDNVFGCLLRYGAHQKARYKQGAPGTGTQVYVRAEPA